ncbi:MULTISPECIES: hypothetical protein, partial [unclassified Ruminococcus]|uniref:hypothetical protein n=1 Tax=unclassified Ruminococcus TaxID=2608920 RepID=UPI00189E6394
PQPLSTPPGVWAGNPVWQGLYTFRPAGCQTAGSGVDTLYALGTCQDLVSGRAVRMRKAAAIAASRIIDNMYEMVD